MGLTLTRRNTWAAMDSIPAGTYDTLYTFLSSDDLAYAWAKSILIGVDSLELDEPLLLPSPEDKRLSGTEKNPFASTQGLLELFPNPAEDFLTVSYRVDRAFRKGEIRIVNQLGQQLYSKTIATELDQLIIEHELEPGYYLLEIRIDDLSYKASSLVIK